MSESEFTKDKEIHIIFLLNAGVIYFETVNTLIWFWHEKCVLTNHINVQGTRTIHITVAVFGLVLSHLIAFFIAEQ